MAAAFILFGNICKPLACRLEELRFKWTQLIIAIIGLVGVVISKTMNPQSVLMFRNQYGDYFWFIIGAVSGIVAMLVLGKYLFMLLKKDEGFLYRLLMWIGFNSLVLFPVHLQIKIYIGTIYIHLGVGHWYFPVVLLTMLLVGVPVCNLITNYLPLLSGSGKLSLKKKTN